MHLQLFHLTLNIPDFRADAGHISKEKEMMGAHAATIVPTDALSACLYEARG